MARIPVTKESLAGKKMKPLKDFRFLASTGHCEILGIEFSQVVANSPIFFVERSGGYVPITLLSLEAGTNQFVDEQGSWTGLYVPAAFRRYPFSVGLPEQNGGQAQLLVEEDVLSDDEGDPLFGETEQDDMEGKSVVGRVLRFFADTEQQGALTNQLIGALAATGIIAPAQAAMRVPEEHPFLPGFFSIDEAKFKALPDQAILDLRRSGALTLAYLQLASLGQLARLQRRHAEILQARGEKVN